MGASYEYAFTDAADLRSYKHSRRTVLKWRDENTLACLCLASVIGTFLMDLFFGWGAPLGFAIGAVLFGLLPEVRRIVGSLDQIKFTLQSDWIGLKERHRTKWLYELPFTVIIRAKRVKSIEWLDEGCLVRRKWSMLPPIYIDCRLLAQPDAIESICHWAEQNRIAMTGTVPVVT